MNRTVFTILITFCAFILEFVISNLFGQSWVPNLCLVVMILLTTTLGIRYGLISAVLGGILKDSFTLNVFGVNTFSLVLSAYLSTFIARNLYHYDSKVSRTLLVFIVSLVNLTLQLFVTMIFRSIDIGQNIRFIFLPEIFMTSVAVLIFINPLRRCVSKFCA